MTFKTLNRIGALALLAAACTAAQAATIDLGVAGGYSGFFFGDVNGAADVEGRLAVGGNLTAGFDVGYRNAYGGTAPSLVVAGNASLTSAWGQAGMIYNGPSSAIDTNASIGPAVPWLPGQVNYGDIVYGGTLTAASWQYGNATQDAGYIDFTAAKTQLLALSGSLSALSQNGSWSLAAGGVSLVGDGQSDVQVFNLGDTALANLTLSNVKAGAHVIINSTLTDVVFSGSLGGDRADSTDGLAAFRDRLLFNLGNASSVSVNTFLNGSVLAVGAAVTGSGHLEGTLIADSLSPSANGSKLELGYEPFVPTTAVPEPRSYALMLAGLMAVVALSRRRQPR